MSVWTTLFLLALSSQALVHLIVHSEITQPIRRLGAHLDDHGRGLIRLLSLPVRSTNCGWCCSWWTTLFLLPVAILSHQQVLLATVALLFLSSLFVGHLLSTICATIHGFQPRVQSARLLRGITSEELETELLLRNIVPGHSETE